ncbi:DUF2783 domain-containing protein [Parasulfitobacter algicola]|uniref:DUF2783 domain-containing protein n=1 Tax=Parasulfitobacter algicola TaxID=2614809 RepID=A0ABX2IXP1_9RHOB|nr:DUF2783 domain-containing protein [Sulfitobacter algicola]NSX55123.1 DUF2783 domain-containing protein [Sulfitobacter algicola]
MQNDNLGVEGDGIYAALMAAHQGLTEAESHALNARLVLIMANEIGDGQKLKTIFSTAGQYAET